MASETVLFILVAVVVVVLVGQLLANSGRRFLASAATGQSRSARPTANLVVVLFHLLTLGLVALIAVLPLGQNTQQVFLLQMGILLLVLAAVYGISLALLARRRDEVLASEIDSREGLAGHQKLGQGLNVTVQPSEAYQARTVADDGPMDPRLGTATGAPIDDNDL